MAGRKMSGTQDARAFYKNAVSWPLAKQRFKYALSFTSQLLGRNLDIRDNITPIRKYAPLILNQPNGKIKITVRHDNVPLYNVNS
jgi:hypothetical protein